MSVVRVKDGVTFSKIAPGGFRMLAAIEHAAQIADLTITSACDGQHSGPNDPHHRGEAYDVRTHDLSEADKNSVLKAIQDFLGDRFFAFLEAANTPNEHIHVQVRKGTVFP